MKWMRGALAAASSPQRRRGIVAAFLLAVLAGFGSSPPALADDQPAADRRPIAGILDNSFLIEEAFNQPPGEVQSLLTVDYGVEPLPGPDDIAWNLAFTQEWPIFNQRHQLSYAIPYSFIRTGGQGDNGLGDVMLNCRFKAYYDEEHIRGFAPRASLVLPTGNKDFGFSDDTVGAQFSLPFSGAWGDRWLTHFNAGLTFLPDAFTANDQDTLDYNLGASVNYAFTSTCHLLLEWTGVWDDSLNSHGRVEHEFLSVISPGLRYAFNFANGSQFVLGLGVPVGLTESAPDVGVFLYVSFEAFWNPN